MLAKHLMEDDQRKDSDKKGATYKIGLMLAMLEILQFIFISQRSKSQFAEIKFYLVLNDFQVTCRFV